MYSENFDDWLGFHSTLELSIMLDLPNLVIFDKHYDPAKDYYKRKALHFACEYGAYRCVEYLLSARGSRDVDAIDDSNRQHIYISVRCLEIRLRQLKRLYTTVALR